MRSGGHVDRSRTQRSKLSEWPVGRNAMIGRVLASPCSVHTEKGTLTGLCCFGQLNAQLWHTMGTSL